MTSPVYSEEEQWMITDNRFNCESSEWKTHAKDLYKVLNAWKEKKRKGPTDTCTGLCHASHQLLIVLPQPRKSCTLERVTRRCCNRGPCWSEDTCCRVTTRSGSRCVGTGSIDALLALVSMWGVWDRMQVAVEGEGKKRVDSGNIDNKEKSVRILIHSCIRVKHDVLCTMFMTISSRMTHPVVSYPLYSLLTCSFVLVLFFVEKELASHKKQALASSRDVHVPNHCPQPTPFKKN